MKCLGPEVIEKYVCKRLNEEESGAVEEHIKECLQCRSRVEDALANESLLAELHCHSTRDVLVTSFEELQVKRINTAERAQELLGDQYTVVKKVGEGASGEVFLVVDKVLDRSVAVKFLNKRARHTNDDEEYRNEGRMMSRLNHPNVAQIYNTGETEGIQHIVMEWVEGIPLTEAWEDAPLENRLALYLEVLEAIDAAHRRSIIHRDIKPSNILVTAGGKVKVLDFGIAIGAQAIWDSDLRLYRGTPAISAPEQFSSPADICPATDVFALGVLLYQLLTDTLPFPQTDPQELFEAIRTSYPELPSAIQGSVPIPLQNICLKALEKDIRNRYPDAQGLSADIRRYLRGEKVWSRPTFLTDKIQQEVFYHDQRLKVWRDNELITQREYDRLETIYDRVVAPSEPSIVELRKLSFSQIYLYLGGWITVVGSTVLLSSQWAQIRMQWRPVPGLVAVLLMLICGTLLWIKKETRLAGGFLVTGNLLLPTVILVALGHWGILTPTLGDEAHDFPWVGIDIGNWQLLACFGAWFLCSLVFLRIVRSSVFVITSVLSCLGILTTVYLIFGMKTWPWDKIGGCYFLPGFYLFVLGMILDHKRYHRYAWPLSGAGLVLIVGGLTAIALSGQTLFGWLAGVTRGQAWYEDVVNSLVTDDHTKKMYGSLALNGTFYLFLGLFCRKQGTRLQRFFAGILYWLGPLHVLSMLTALNQDDSDPHQLVYRLLLPATSLILVFRSTAVQMKSFFFSGLMGIAASIQKMTEMYFNEPVAWFFAWPVSLVVAGILLMMLAWWLPHREAKLFLKRKKRRP